MRRHHILPTLVSALLGAVACHDAAAPAAPRQSAPVTPAAPQAPPSVANDGVALWPRNVSVLVGDSLTMEGYAYRGQQVADTLDWAVNDTTLASLQVVGLNRILIRPLRTGYLTVSATARNAPSPLAASTSVKVLAGSLQPPPVEVTEFYVREYLSYVTSQWHYAPQLALRATSPDSVPIASVTVEIPGLARTMFCQTSGGVRNSLRPLFAPLGDGMMMIFSESGRRASPGAQAVARITVILSDGTGARLVAKGAIDNQGEVIQTYLEAPGDWLSCG